MKSTKDFIFSELTGFYERSEIDSFIRLVFETLFGYSRKEMILFADRRLSSGEREKISGIVERLKKYEPIQYILGTTEFYGLKFHVEPGVLIPRFETEELVDTIIKQNKNKKVKLLDLGCGSGCIAIALKKFIQESDVWCCDISDTALKITRENAMLNEAEIHIVKYDILSRDLFPETGFDIVVSNPPYVTIKERSVMQKNVLDYEPEVALFVPDEDPLLFYREIVNKTRGIMADSGQLFFEINESYGDEVSALIEKYGFHATIIKDINGRDRFVTGTL